MELTHEQKIRLAKHKAHFYKSYHADLRKSGDDFFTEKFLNTINGKEFMKTLFESGGKVERDPKFRWPNINDNDPCHSRSEFKTVWLQEDSD